MRLHYCSFCGKSEKQLKLIVAGPDVDICDACIELAHEIVLEHRAGTWSEMTFADCQEARP
jgi:ATP-dependent Clp protease ATP-binding subunit ClpX